MKAKERWCFNWRENSVLYYAYVIFYFLYEYIDVSACNANILDEIDYSYTVYNGNTNEETVYNDINSNMTIDEIVLKKVEKKGATIDDVQ